MHIVNVWKTYGGVIWSLVKKLLDIFRVKIKGEDYLQQKNNWSSSRILQFSYYMRDTEHGSQEQQFKKRK